jgi:hypothetical protein
MEIPPISKTSEGFKIEKATQAKAPFFKNNPLKHFLFTSLLHTLTKIQQKAHKASQKLKESTSD